MGNNANGQAGGWGQSSGGFGNMQRGGGGFGGNMRQTTPYQPPNDAMAMGNAMQKMPDGSFQSVPIGGAGMSAPAPQMGGMQMGVMQPPPSTADQRMPGGGGPGANGAPLGWVPDPGRAGGVRPWDPKGFDPTQQNGQFYKPPPQWGQQVPGAPMGAGGFQRPGLPSPGPVTPAPQFNGPRTSGGSWG